MIYSFEDVNTGEPVEVEMSMRDAVDFGACITRKGRKLRRVHENPATTQLAVQRDINAITGYSQQPYYTRAEQQATGHPHWDNDPKSSGYGCPVFTSRNDIQKYLKKNGGVYDAGGGINEVKR